MSKKKLPITTLERSYYGSKIVQFDDLVGSAKQAFREKESGVPSSLGYYSEMTLGLIKSDMQTFLEVTGSGFNGEFTISYNDGKVDYMKATFEAKNKEMNTDKYYQHLLEFIGEYGFITHKKFGTEKKLCGEKYYKYKDNELIQFELGPDLEIIGIEKGQPINGDFVKNDIGGV